MIIPLIMSTKITLAGSIVDFQQLCSESLRRRQRMEMVWKNTAAANCLLEASPPKEIAFQMAASEVGAEDDNHKGQGAKTTVHLPGCRRRKCENLILHSGGSCGI